MLYKQVFLASVLSYLHLLGLLKAFTSTYVAYGSVFVTRVTVKLATHVVGPKAMILTGQMQRDLSLRPRANGRLPTPVY